MRTLFVITTAALLIPIAGMSQSKSTAPPAKPGATKAATTPAAPPPAGMECADHLQMPDFPKTALESKVDGSVWTWFGVTPQGKAEQIKTQVVSAYGTGPNLLTPPVEKALQESQFKSSCAGKTVAVVFRYELHGEATANPKVTTRTENPNIVYIESQPETTTVSANHAPKKR